MYDLQKERGKAKQTLKSKMGANGLQKNLVTHLQMDDVESEQLVSKEAIEFPLVRQLFFVVVFHFNRFGASTYLLMMVFLHSGFTFHFYNLLITKFLLAMCHFLHSHGLIFYCNIWTEFKPILVENDRVEGTAEGQKLILLREVPQ